MMTRRLLSAALGVLASLFAVDALPAPPAAGQRVCCDNLDGIAAGFERLVAALTAASNAAGCTLTWRPSDDADGRKFHAWLRAHRTTGPEPCGVSGCVNSSLAMREINERLERATLQCGRGTPLFDLDVSLAFVAAFMPRSEGASSSTRCLPCAAADSHPPRALETEMLEIHAEQPAGSAVMRYKRPGASSLTVAELSTVVQRSGVAVGFGVAVTPWRAIAAVRDSDAPPELAPAPIAAGGGARVRPVRVFSSSLSSVPVCLKTFTLSLAGLRHVTSQATGLGIALNGDFWNHRDPRSYLGLATCIAESVRGSGANLRDAVSKCSGTSQDGRRLTDAFGWGVRLGFASKDGDRGGPLVVRNGSVNLAWDYEFDLAGGAAALTVYGDAGAEEVINNPTAFTSHLGARFSWGNTDASLSAELGGMLLAHRAGAAAPYVPAFGAEGGLLLTAKMLGALPAMIGVRFTAAPAQSGEYTAVPTLVMALGAADQRGSRTAYASQLREALRPLTQGPPPRPAPTN